MEEAASPASESSDSPKTPLRAVRTAQRRTLEEVASATGIDISTLSRIERGEKTSADTAEKLAKYFGPSLIDEMRILYPERFQ